MQDIPTIYNLNLTDCKTQRDIHQRIKDALNFPDYYGMNWNAFWDIIREFGPSLIRIKGMDTKDTYLYEHFQTMLSILEEAKQKYHMINYTLM